VPGRNGRPYQSTDAVLFLPFSIHGKALIGKNGHAIAEKWYRILKAELIQLGRVSIGPTEPFNVSSVIIRYVQEHPLGRAAVVEASLVRYDFADEWNNSLRIHPAMGLMVYRPADCRGRSIGGTGLHKVCAFV
jgi:hypothetical protein